MNNQPTALDDLIVYGGTLLTMDAQMRIIPHGVIHIQGGKIVSIESIEKFTPPSGVQLLDAQGGIVLPGFINGHTHVGMSLLRGIADDYPLDEWLTKHIFPLERQFGSKEFVELGTELACVEMIKSGTTFFNDMYYFESAAAAVTDRMGMRAICGQTHVEISGVESNQEIFKKFDQFIEEIEKFPLIQPALAPHSIYGLSEQLWKDLVKYARNHQLLIHTHLCETQQEIQKTRLDKGLTPVEWFDSIGLWDQAAICAHAIELSSADIKLLGKKQVGIVYNPESNLKLGNGICPVVELRVSGAPVAFGTDSTASNNNLDLLQEAASGSKLQTFKYGVGKLKAIECVKILTIEAARALRVDDQVGSLDVGKSADLVVLDINQAHSAPLYDWYSHVIYSALQSDVRHSVVAGQILMKNRTLTRCDEREIVSRAQSWGKRIQAVNAELAKTT